jgi:saccharopine dehydrogenase (NAD+, L-lysine forming)
LRHAHIQFGHCYKQQTNWDKYLSRFARGNGLLYDIEFLTDEFGRRVSAFGYHAGYSGTAIALISWTNQILNPGSTLGPISSYPSEATLVNDIQAKISEARSVNKEQFPRVLVIGALGRCGTGAVNACRAAGIPEENIIKWDMAETAKGGPFKEIAEADIFVNCIYLTQKIPAFVNLESLAQPGRRLRVICDVSCDPNNPNNPIPVYTECTTFTQPDSPVDIQGDGPPLVQVSIDHFPSLLPREASEAFSQGLLPSLLALRNRHEDGVWVRAEKIYREKVNTLPASLR